MRVNNINNIFSSNEVVNQEIAQWLNHGYNLNATHAVLYFDQYEQCQAMGYVFPPSTLDEKIASIKSDGGTNLICWEYTRDK